MASEDGSRLGMALVQYNEALRSLRPAGDVLAAEHLFMAVEALVGIVHKRALHDLDMATEEDLARYFELQGEPWELRNALTGYLRREIIFSGDETTHRSLKKASDGFEHGFLSMDAVGKHVESTTLSVALSHVRNTILMLLGLPEPLRGYLAAAALTVNDRVHPSVRGVIDGDTAEPEDPTTFKTLDFTLDLIDLVPVDGGLHLHLEPTLDLAFGDSASLTRMSLQLYRERYDLPEHDGQ